MSYWSSGFGYPLGELLKECPIHQLEGTIYNVSNTLKEVNRIGLRSHHYRLLRKLLSSLMVRARDDAIHFLAALAALYLTLVCVVAKCHFRILTQRVTFET